MGVTQAVAAEQERGLVRPGLEAIEEVVPMLRVERVVLVGEDQRYGLVVQMIHASMEFQQKYR